MRRPSATSAFPAARRRLVLVAAGFAVIAMAALHLVQPELHPVAEPVSFYVWGRHGWLLCAALGAFGLALLLLARGPAAASSAASRRTLTLAGAVLLGAAAIPSDRWFPWEQTPTFSGLAHAAAAMIAPPLLLWPMLTWPPPQSPRARALLRWTTVAYAAGLGTSAASLLVGFLRDGPPPGIGLVERVLAFAAVAWVSLVAWNPRHA